MIELFYKVILSQGTNVIAALACEEIRRPKMAELVIPYRDPDGQVYGITCYMIGIPNNVPMVAAMFTLQGYARLLARRGGKGEQFEGVVAMHSWVEDGKQQRMAEFARPQDFAVRGLGEGNPDEPWRYSLINYIATQDIEDEHFPMRANTSYIVNGYLDTKESDVETINLFGAVAAMMTMELCGPPPPMRPTDCLGEDDWWDRDALGDPPPDCPDDNNW